MKNRGKILLSILLAAVMVPMVAVGVRTYAAEECEVTVKADDGAKEYITKSAEYGEIVYDLYRLDDLAEYKAAYKLIETKLEDNSNLNLTIEYQKLAQAMMEALCTPSETNYTIDRSKADYSANSLNSAVDVENGTYLLVAHAQPLPGTTAAVNEVITKVSQLSANSTQANSVIATTMQIADVYYTIMPQLITAPIKVDNNGKAVLRPSDEGTWKYEQTVTLKMMVDPDYGSIIIDKTLVGSPVEMENATCIFQVDVYYPNETEPHSEVYTISFTTADFPNGATSSSKALTINGIPLGSTVEVFERYSGGRYIADVVYPNGQNVVVTTKTPEHVTFNNTPNTEKGGGGLTNHFTYVEKEGNVTWEWEKVGDNVNTKNGRIHQFMQDNN